MRSPRPETAFGPSDHRHPSFCAWRKNSRGARPWYGQNRHRREKTAGELGLGTAKNAVNVKRPRLNPNLDPNTVGVVEIAAGGMHCIALTADNKILTLGLDDQGTLGRDTTWDRTED